MLKSNLLFKTLFNHVPRGQ